MNREAVALGTPVYTLFEGKLGAVDERLLAEGRLRQLRSADEIALVKLGGQGDGERGDGKRDGHAERVRRDPGVLADLLLSSAADRHRA
jgi:hypothetical protein